METSLQETNTSALDLVEELRLLDEIADQGNMENRRLGDSSGAHYNGCSPERSIGEPCDIRRLRYRRWRVCFV